MAGKWAGGGHGEELSRTCLAGINVGEHDVLFVVCRFIVRDPGEVAVAPRRRAEPPTRAAPRGGDVLSPARQQCFLQRSALARVR